MAKRAALIQKKDEPTENDKYVLRLFVTGASPNSIRAITNLKTILENYLKDQYSLEIIDVYQQKSIAATEQIIAMPVMIKKYPLPERRLIGDMSDEKKVLKGLGLLEQ
jgi:circadian clock protein KaiB